MRVLVAEDEPTLNARLGEALAAAGYVVDSAHDGEQAWFFGGTEPYDAVVLDLGLPKLDGVTILRRWRDEGRNMPVLILTARSRWAEKATAFTAGADDYVTKPFEMDEVVYRIHALIRRAAGHASPEIVCGDMRVDMTANSVQVGEVHVPLTTHEFRILSYLALHKGCIVSRAELFEHVYGRNDERDSNVLDVLIGRIRKKIGYDFVVTIRGQGWRLDPTHKRRAADGL